MKSKLAAICILGGFALAVPAADAKVVFTPVSTPDGSGYSATNTTQVTNPDGTVTTVTRTETTVTKNDGTVEEIIEIIEAEAVPDGTASSGFMTTVTVRTTTFVTPPGGDREETDSSENVGTPQDEAPPVLPEVPSLETSEDTPVISEA
jgi:hypothetical protein